MFLAGKVIGRNKMCMFFFPMMLAMMWTIFQCEFAKGHVWEGTCFELDLDMLNFCSTANWFLNRGWMGEDMCHDTLECYGFPKMEILS